ncbi:MAG: inositol monophosphatase [Chlamydiia bacterium]|nr:inositol monophosphatase [Chlamydiia bacterium]
MDAILVETKQFDYLTLIAIEAALEAGDILRKGFGSHLTISSKEGKHNLVTQYDTLSEKAIIELLRSHVPSSHFLAEESGASGAKGDFLWIIDPLDGTVNFAHQIPFFSVSVALEQKGQILCGVIYHPLQQELFVAERGKGAFLNGVSLRVSPVSQIDQSILATGFPYNLATNPYHCIEHFIDIMKLGIPVRRLGSAALDLAYTAAGRFEGFFEVGLSPWDCAAGVLLIEEAGGKVTSWNQSPFSVHSKKPILATNGLIHQAASAILSRSVP